MKKLYKEYVGLLMESSAYETEEFKSFARKAKNRLKKDLQSTGLELAGWSKGHFEVSGFIFNPNTSKYAYFIIGDMRWKCLGKQPLDSCLVRTCKDIKDYHGGTNNFCRCYDIVAKAKALTA